MYIIIHKKVSAIEQMIANKTKCNYLTDFSLKSPEIKRAFSQPFYQELTYFYIICTKHHTLETISKQDVGQNKSAKTGSPLKQYVPPYAYTLYFHMSALHNNFCKVLRPCLMILKSKITPINVFSVWILLPFIL